ncbi:mannose phosphate isomerase isoform X2 [Tachypleus tridentatus]|uniref:mannose phosphate isomerase isoform X2 n=1 Tax=Tachypleus tridentatus TaxID=6853 RepID=UPI003FD2DD11
MSRTIEVLSPRVFQLKCPVQKYAWGKLGLNSEVAQLKKSADTTFSVEECETYAELWMGTHPSGPATIINNPTLEGTLLKDWIIKHPESIGQKVEDKFGPDLPFLFKVLSVNKALSIQAHPTKEHAERLHQLMPDKYPDPNHKPEMTIALTPFEALCGFRPLSEIKMFFEVVPELKAVVGEVAAELISAESRQTLKNCFTSLMTCPEESFKKHLHSLIKRLQDTKQEDKLDQKLRSLLLRVHSQFPGDIGCFGVFFFNYIVLEPGEAMFLAANEPHAYLAGDCVECMACSDNVVRAGLTPKFKDVKTLCEMLTYQSRSVKDTLFPSVNDPCDKFVVTYNPPVPEFAVSKIQIPAGTSSYELQVIDSGSILLILSGGAQARNATLGSGSLALSRGTIIFVSAGETLQLKDISKNMLMFRAMSKL